MNVNYVFSYMLVSITLNLLSNSIQHIAYWGGGWIKKTCKTIFLNTGIRIYKLSEILNETK